MKSSSPCWMFLVAIMTTMLRVAAKAHLRFLPSPLLAWLGGRRDRDAGEETWRSSEDGKSSKSRKEDAPAKKESRSGLSALKKSTPQLQWRGLINKFTPEKFDKLCEQLLSTLREQLVSARSAESPSAAASSGQFKQVLEDLLTLIFEASSRQHQYTEMYTDLTEKILSFVSKERPELDGKACVWEKCQHIFLTMVLKTPEIPTDLPEDEYMDRKAKTKEKMVGMVKLGGDLVSRGLVPCEGVMQWIHSLLSEKTQEVYCPGKEAMPQEEDGAQEKDMEQREVQLEVLCAILASMGSSLSDRNTWSEENRLVIEDVFMQLEQLSMDTAHLSLRIRCLIRDVLDLRMAHWKEKEGKLKPGMLHSRKKESDDEQGDGGQREETHEAKQWLDPQLLSSLQAVKHHLEVYDDKEAKFTRLTSLIKVYHIMKEKQIVIVANSSNVKQVLELIAESFKDLDCRSLDFSTPEQIRKKCIKSFESGDTSVLVLASEVSTRRDFDFGKPSPVLVNFDFPMTLQLYLYRIFKRADSTTHVYTFFSSHSDVRHTTSLVAAMEGAKQQVPAALQKLKDQVRSEGAGKREPGSRRTPKGGEPRQEVEEEAAPRGERGERVPPWKERRSGAPQGDGARDDRPPPSDHQWEDVWSRDEAGEGGRSGFRSGRSKPSGASWRDGRRDECRDEAGHGTPAAGARQGEEPQLRRRDTARRPEVAADQHDGEGWQKTRGANGRRAGGRGRDGGGEEKATDDSGPRAERPPWFEPNVAESHEPPRRQILLRSQSSPNEQPAGPRPEVGNPRTPTVGGSASSAVGTQGSSIRQRRHEPSADAQCGSADVRKEPRSRFMTDAPGEPSTPAEKEHRHPGHDRQREGGHPAGAGMGSRGSGGGGSEANPDRHTPSHGHRHHHGAGRAGDQQGGRREHLA
mmetsp:Transcript_60874/g.188480  ORF Transcript_60874/g.188480 Transcript_60874/m.188480 type:complete len:914 (+) Transcript_60874:203-2944(+)